MEKLQPSLTKIIQYLKGFGKAKTYKQQPIKQTMYENPEETELAEEREKTAYVAGVVDGSSSLIASVTKSNEHRLGYFIRPRFRLTRSVPHSLEVVDDFALEHGVHANLYEEDGNYVFEIKKRDYLVRFLEEIYPYIQDRREEIEMMVNTIIPALERGDHLEEESFVQLVNDVEILRDMSPHTNHTKYDAEYFKNLWDVEQ